MIRQSTKNHKQPLLSTEQVDQVYSMYYDYDLTRPRPTIEYLAHLFNISKSRLHIILNKEHQHRTNNNQVTTINDNP